MEYRAYSISSIPNQEFLQLTIKRVEGGKVSNYLIDQLNEGDEVAVLAPTGPFNSIDCKPRKKWRYSAQAVASLLSCRWRNRG